MLYIQPAWLRNLLSPKPANTHPACLRTLLSRIAEDTNRIHLRRGKKVAEQIEIGRSLSRKTADDVAADSGGRRQPSDRLNQCEEGFGVTEAPHPAQNTGGSVLKREIEVRKDFRCAGHDIDQAAPHLGWLQIGNPDPGEAVEFGEIGEQAFEQPDVAEVLAIA